MGCAELRASNFAPEPSKLPSSWEIALFEGGEVPQIMGRCPVKGKLEAEQLAFKWARGSKGEPKANCKVGCSHPAQASNERTAPTTPLWQPASLRKKQHHGSGSAGEASPGARAGGFVQLHSDELHLPQLRGELDLSSRNQTRAGGPKREAMGSHRKTPREELCA